MEDKIYINNLLDFYGSLMTEKQRAICTYYYNEDLSLQEIAEIENVSRSAVYDIVNRCRKELNNYEEKLHLYEAWSKRQKLYKQMRQINNEEINHLIDECIKTEME